MHDEITFQIGICEKRKLSSYEERRLEKISFRYQNVYDTSITINQNGKFISTSTTYHTLNLVNGTQQILFQLLILICFLRGFLGIDRIFMRWLLYWIRIWFRLSEMSIESMLSYQIKISLNLIEFKHQKDATPIHTLEKGWAGDI